ncbi:glycine/betaine ABC transporter substrate-binding protein [Rhodococcus qingshengii]|nr:glycine/betaine ABC transporter substrate-binding protein [Rhodococcus qingshengii]
MKNLFVFCVSLFLIFMTACSSSTTSNSEGKSTQITIGGKVFTEQVVLVNIMAELLKDRTDHDISTEEGLGSSQVLMQAMTDDDIQIYADYTGTGYINILKNELKPEDTADSIYKMTKEGYENEYGFTWLKPMNFSNTWTLIMKEEKAKELNIKTFSDLAAHTKKLSIGSDAQFFERGDGYEGMVEKYGYADFKETKEMDIGLAFQALDKGQIDVLVGYATDGRIPALNLVTLKDDKGYFPPYFPAPILKEEFAEKHPEVVEALNELADKLDEKTIADLNARVDVEKKDPISVANEFLKESGLVK